MDPFSVTAGIITVTQQLFKIQKAFSSRNDRSRTVVQDAIGDLPVYIDILNDMSTTMISFQGTMPPASQSCLQLCYHRATRVADLMSKGDTKSSSTSKDKTTLVDLEYAMQQFRQAVSLLRDITMDAMTHHLLRSQQLEFARLSTARSHGTAQPGRPNPPKDPTAFDATIFRGVKDGPQWIAGRGILDSGCDDNWISLDIVKRAGMASLMVRTAQDKIYTGFGGQNIEPQGVISVTWYANNASKTRQTPFLIAERGPFDLLLGKNFIFSENIFMFNHAALVLRAAPISEEERMQMEANAIQSSATNDQLEAIRRAGEASLRNQYREQNHSMLYPDPNPSISGSSSTRSTPSMSFSGTGGS